MESRTLGLETLSSRRWTRNLCHYYKLLISGSPSYLSSIIPQRIGTVQTRSALGTPPPKTRAAAFKSSFFNVICEWNKLNNNIRSFIVFLGFKNTILNPLSANPTRIKELKKRVKEIRPSCLLTQYLAFIIHLD